MIGKSSGVGDICCSQTDDEAWVMELDSEGCGEASSGSGQAPANCAGAAPQEGLRQVLLDQRWVSLKAWGRVNQGNVGALVPPNLEELKAAIAVREMEKFELGKCVENAEAVHRVWLRGSRARLGEAAIANLQHDSEAVKTVLQNFVTAIRSSGDWSQAVGLLKLGLIKAEIDLTRQLLTSGHLASKSYDEASLIESVFLIKKTLWEDFIAALMEERAKAEQDLVQLNQLLDKLTK